MQKSQKHLLTGKEVLERRASMTYTERFHLWMRLIRINRMLKKATIIPAKK